ncbi:MAG: hypothetical protein IT534_12675 [Bauldia sp.]|nr:hypothetical protein [Bauldia sp.]
MVVGRIVRRLILGFGVIAATAGAADAQPVSRPELNSLLARVIGDSENAVEAMLATDAGFTADSAALLVTFASTIYADPEFQSYLLARIEEYDRAVILQSIDDLAATARADAYRYGTLRLPPSGLSAFVDHIRDVLLWLAATDPALCAALVQNPAAVLDGSDIELQYFAQISPEELRATLRYRTAAIIAETSDAPPWHAFSRAELTEGRLALSEVLDEAAPLPPPGATCTIASICIPPPTMDETRCTRGLIRYEAFGALAEPQRSWAIAAFITDL